MVGVGGGESRIEVTGISLSDGGRTGVGAGSFGVLMNLLKILGMILV